MDIIHELESYGIEVVVHDPLAPLSEALLHYGITLHALDDMKDLGALILAVPHRAYREMPLQSFERMLGTGGCLVDVKSMLSSDEAARCDLPIWRL